MKWRRIGALFAPYWKQLGVVLLCIFVTQTLGLAPAWMTAHIIDDAIPHHNYRLAVIYVALMVASALISMASGVVQGYFNSSAGESILRDLRSKLVSHLHRVPISFFTRTKTGEIMNRVSSDVDNIDNIVTGTLTSIVTNVVMILTTAIVMLLWNAPLALLSFSVVPLMLVPIGSVGRKMYNMRKKTRVQRDQMGAITQETLSVSGITLIKSFARESHELKRFYSAGTKLRDLEVRLAMAGRWFMVSVGAMITIGPALVWLGGSWYAIQGRMDVGIVVAFVAYIGGRLYGPASNLVGIQAQVVSALAVFERIFEYLDIETEWYVPVSATQLVEPRGMIAFDRVTFSYGTDRLILRDVSFTVEAGQVAAIVGSSGAGKSTIAQLLPRFYDPESGKISIDGRDTRTVTLKSLRRNIGIVTQETFLFHDTIFMNLRYARPDATDEELFDACRAANVHEIIEEFPDGYDTIVGERGYRLSGGERQRIAIARVLLKSPRILIFDEATSALDSHSEAAIQNALEMVMRGRTSIIIAHRLSTIVNADVIFVLEEGHIVERGSHAELLARHGKYASLYHTQTRLAPPSYV